MTAAVAGIRPVCTGMRQLGCRSHALLAWAGCALQRA